MREPSRRSPRVADPPGRCTRGMVGENEMPGRAEAEPNSSPGKAVPLA